jgi:hypothetical protein
VAEPQPPNDRRFTPSFVLAMIAVGIFVMAFVAVAVLLVMKMVGAAG